MTHIVGKLGGVLKRLANQRALQHMPAQQPQYLEERLQKRRKESTIPEEAVIADSRF